MFGCGYNGYQNQGDGTTTNVKTFTQRLSGENIKDIAISENTTWAVTTDGKLFGCGYNSSGQQGDGTTTTVATFTQRLSTETIASVSCSNNVTWVVTTDGKLFGCGENNSSQQGDGTTTNVTSFTQRLDTETIASVSCTSTTTWAVTTDGKLFGCGFNHKSQQGDGTTTTVTSFTQRLSGETIASVYAYSGVYPVTWAVTTDGKLFGCGDNEYGEQGNGQYGANKTVKTFTQRLDTETITKISSSGQTWAVTTDGKLFGCGYNSSGQQGDGTTTTVATFTQRGPSGTVNIPPTLNLSPLNIPNLSPGLHLQPSILNVQSVTPGDIVGTDYTFLAGGNDWLLCTVSVGADQYALALYYAGLTEPLLWDEDVTLLFSNGSVTFENNGQSYTMTYTSIFFRGDGGEYLLAEDSAYIEADTQIIGYSIPTTDSAIIVSGTLTTMDAELMSGAITLGDVTTTTSDTDYDGVSSLTDISVAYDTSETATCTNVIVPKSVVITETVEDHTIDDIMSIIPLFLVIAVLVMLVSGLLMKRY